MRERGPDLALSLGGAGMAPLWRHAASPRVRDLAWSTLSPGLLAHLPPEYNGDSALARWPTGTREAWRRWLEAAAPDGLPVTLAELASGHADVADAVPAGAAGAPPAGLSLRLGRHAERLVHFAMEHAEGLQLLAANLPVRRAVPHGVQTLGELDFVWRDLASGETVHWEMAAKFYLMIGEDDGAAPRREAFVGPNLVDRLGDKLDHLVHRQLSLSRSAEARALLGHTVDRREVYLLGWLFYRDGRVPQGLGALGIAGDHLHGWWSSLEDWAVRATGSEADAGVRWCRLPRASWLSGARVAEAETESVAALHAALAQRFADPHRERGWRRESPVMLCELEPADVPGAWRERSRGFVVPPGWVERAAARAAQTPSRTVG